MLGLPCPPCLGGCDECDPCQTYTDELHNGTLDPWTEEDGAWTDDSTETSTEEAVRAALIYPETCPTNGHFRTKVTPTYFPLSNNRLIWLFEDADNYWFANFYDDGTDFTVSIYERASGTDNLKSTATALNGATIDYLLACYDNDRINAAIVDINGYVQCHAAYAVTLPTTPSRFGLGKGSSSVAAYVDWELIINNVTEEICGPCNHPGLCGICASSHNPTLQYLVTIANLTSDCSGSCSNGNLSWLVNFQFGGAGGGDAFCRWRSANTVSMCGNDVYCFLDFTKIGSSLSAHAYLTHDPNASPTTFPARFLKSIISLQSCDTFSDFDLNTTVAGTCTSGSSTGKITAIA